MQEGLRRVPEYRKLPRRAASTWLARIVINESYARLRKQKRASVVVPFESTALGAEEGVMAESTTGGRRPPPCASCGAAGAPHRRAAGQFRVVFVLRDVEEMSAEETAECLEVPPATVRTRAFRARALLRESLSRDLDAVTVDAFGFAGERCDRIVAHVLQRVRLLNPL